MSPLDISSSPNQRWLAREFASSLEQSHRSTRNDVHGYVEFAQHLGETEGPEPDPAFCAALRHRLLHELIEDELVPPYDELALRRETRRKAGSHCFERAPREPWIAAASTVLVVCGGAVGLGQDSSQALPGDVLYPVKRFFESGETALADSADGEARELMEQATERLDEARQLVKVHEIHAQQALPETIIDFNEATTEAGNLIVQQSREHEIDPTVISEFHAFSTESRTALDEIAQSADGETASLIEAARSTLDGFDALLPALDPVLDTSQDPPVTSEALNVPGLGGNEHADRVNEPQLEASDTDTTGPKEAAGPAIDQTLDDTVNATLDDATAGLGVPVSVVDVSTSDTVSVAVATVHNTAKVVNRTARTAVDSVQTATDRNAPTLPDVADDAARDAVGALHNVTSSVL